MTQFTDEQIDRTIDTCREHLGEIAGAIQAAFGCEIRLAAGEARGVGTAEGLADFQTPGLAVAVAIGEQGIVVLIPQNLPIPAWYREPDAGQSELLQTLANQLSLQLLPADLVSERSVALATENLIEVAQSAQAAPSAKMVELSVFHPDGTHEAAFAKILVIVPVLAPPVPAADSVPAVDAAPQRDESLEEFGVAENPEQHFEARSATSSPDASVDAALRALRILQVPVTVSVRLAERKMSLGAVMALVPGSLVTFSKSCEELLDLYVNNHRYCQGEAIKIGESFGLRVSRVGVTEERRERII
jgi:flagellar motor switch protein FliN